jgi:hypothetical protein
MPYVQAVSPADFLKAHLAVHPEDASTLGIPGHAERLPRVEPIAFNGGDEDLDSDAAARVSLGYSRPGLESSLELAALPNAMLQHAALHATTTDDWRAIAARAARVPAFLEARAEGLRRGVLDQNVLKVFAERVLPNAADAIASLAFTAAARKCPSDVVALVAESTRAASSAYRALAARELATRSDVVLGDEETTLRLRDVMGVAAGADDLVAEAREDLARLRPKIDRDALLKVLAPRPSTLDEALAGYRRWLVEATNFVRDHDLVPIPPALALDLEPMPGGIADGSSVTNWPAPLFDPKGKGHLLYASDPGAHSTVAMKNLAVHEGIPGHYLQSAYWQRNAKPEHACRWLGVADDVAFAWGYFGAMLAVEGWAVRMEHLLRRHGFYDTPEEQLFFDFCDVIRAMRVVLDLELQRGRMSGEEATRFVAETTSMPEGWAHAQVVRAKRLPLQGLTYQVGAREIERLRRSFRGDELEFHERLLAAGPVPPSRAARFVLA